jgi:hypothetical protein
MSNLILHEVAGHHTRLHMTDSTMPEGVHPTGFQSQFFAEWRYNPSANVTVLRMHTGMPVSPPSAPRSSCGNTIRRRPLICSAAPPSAT